MREKTSQNNFVIKTYKDGVNDPIFFDAANPIEIGEFSYSSQRMGATPNITATLMHEACLDNYWTKKEYIEYNGEKYFIRVIPSSSKSNDDARYKHDLKFVSERFVLENVYFFDVLYSYEKAAYFDNTSQSYIDVVFENADKELEEVYYLISGSQRSSQSKAQAISYKKVAYFDDSTQKYIDVAFENEDHELEDAYYEEREQSGTIEGAYVSNSTKVMFYGDIHEFALRLQYTLNYNAIDYNVVVDEGIESDFKEVSFADTYIANAMQISFELYNIPYYFVGKTIHFGYTENVVTETFSYGDDLASNSLLKISKNNENFKNVTFCTGIGSADNLPYYYPNLSEDRETEAGWIEPTTNLMPPVYRNSKGSDRFYPALNREYLIPETGEYYEFENEHNVAIPSQHKVDFVDIKPTIIGIVNDDGQLIGSITEFAYDENDNDKFKVVDNAETAEYEHPYFYAKLKKFNGTNGFNLFDHAIDSESATIVMHSGKLKPAKFVIGVVEAFEDGKQVFRNPVQVDSQGNIVAGDFEDKVNESNLQARQQNTQTNEVWIALKKDIDTFGVLMPNVNRGFYPSAEDQFVILGIDLPLPYILAAEKRLEEAIVRHMAQNNSDKFKYTIDFSRIFLEQNPQVLAQLNENSRVAIEYNGKVSTFYVSQYTYKKEANSHLPAISITLVDTITVQRSGLQNSISEIKQDVINSVGGSQDFLKQGLKYFLRKDVDDRARGNVASDKGFEIGRFVAGFSGQGGKIYKDANGKVNLEVDNIYARAKAFFDTLEINKIQANSGNRIASAASIKCIRVEETLSGYKCYFKADDGDNAIKNDFVVGDFAMCKVFNIKTTTASNFSNRYYWRDVIAVGDDFITLSKDANQGDIPLAGDPIIQLGNENDTSRQNAIEESVVGTSTPSYRLLQGINTKSLEDKSIIRLGFNSVTGVAEFISYGDAWIGSRKNGRRHQGVEIDTAGDLNIYTERFTIRRPGTSDEIDIEGNIDNASTAAEEAKEDAKKANNAAKEAKEDAKKANDAAGALDTKVDDLNSTINGAFKDGVLDEAEKAAIQKALEETGKGINSLFNSMTATYNEIANNEHLGGYALTALERSYSAIADKSNGTFALLMGCIDNLLAQVNEQALSEYNNAYQAFDSSLATYQGDLELANSYIQNTILSSAYGYSDGVASDLANYTTITNERLTTAEAGLNNQDIRLEVLENQADSKVEIWEGNYVPTLDNYPANDWVESNTEADHVGDYFDMSTATEEEDSVGNTIYAIQRYKFVDKRAELKSDLQYGWEAIADSAGAYALEQAKIALGVAEGKNKTTYSNEVPPVPYVVNDMWVNTAENNSIYLCITAKDKSQPRNLRDWSIVNDAQYRLGQMASDGVISKEEKVKLRDEKAQIESEMSEYRADADSYKVSKTALELAYSALMSDFSSILRLYNSDNSPSLADTPISASNRNKYNQDVASYYAERSRFAKNIAEKLTEDATSTLDKKIDDLNTTITTSFKDGVLDEAEKKAIQKALEETDKGVKSLYNSLSATYERVINNEYLDGSAKVNLEESYNIIARHDGTYETLLGCIEALLAQINDQFISEYEQAYQAFDTSLATYQGDLELANQSIQIHLNALADGYAGDVASDLANYKTTANERLTANETNLGNQSARLDALESQADGKIEIWEGDYVPTLENYPANGWVDAGTESDHVGDYFDMSTATEEEDSAGNTIFAIQRYKFVDKRGDITGGITGKTKGIAPSIVLSNYAWEAIADSAGAYALEQAEEALKIANGKSKTTYSNEVPPTPYSVGDLWINTAEAETIYLCFTAKKETEAKNKTDWQVVNDAQYRQGLMASDGVISKEEKVQYRDQRTQIEKEMSSYTADSNSSGVALGGLQTAYNTLINDYANILKLGSSSSDDNWAKDTPITSENRLKFNQDLAKYYAERNRFANAIADKLAKDAADEAKKEADEAKKEAEKANNAASTLDKKIDDLNTTITTSFKDGVLDEAEKKAIQKALEETDKGVKSLYNSLSATYEKIVNNEYLDGSAKVNLEESYSIIARHDGTYETLIDCIDALLAQISNQALSEYEQAYQAFDTSLATYQGDLELANQSIQIHLNSLADGYAGDVASDLANYKTTANERLTANETNLGNQSARLDALESQADGKIEIWEGNYVPTLENYPANDWVETGTESDHVGDYFDMSTATEEEDSVGNTIYAIQRYKFVDKRGDITGGLIGEAKGISPSVTLSNYEWEAIADSAGAYALEQAEEALKIANGKSKTTYSNEVPPTPYSVGDLWINTAEAETIYLCFTAKKETEAKNKTDWQVVNDAQYRQGLMASDGVISKEEKVQYRDQRTQIEKEMSSYTADSSSNGVALGGLQTAYNTLISDYANILKLGSSSSDDNWAKDTPITPGNRLKFNQDLAKYYAERNRFANAMADKLAKDAVDGIVVGGTNLITGSKLDKEEERNFTLRTLNSVSTKEYINSSYHFTTPNSGNPNNGIYLRIPFKELGLTYGDVVSFSIDIKGVIDTATGISGIAVMHSTADNQNDYGYIKTFNYLHSLSTSLFMRQSITFDIPAENEFHNTNKDHLGILFRSGYNANVYIKKAKLERGNKPTDWSEAPSELKNEAVASFFGGEITSSDIKKMREGDAPFVWDTEKEMAYFRNALVDRLATDQAFINQLFANKVVALGANNVMIASMNINGDGAYIQYWEDGATPRMSFSAGYITYYNRDGDILWKLGEDGAIDKLNEFWTSIYLFETNSTYSNIKHRDYLTGDEYKKFSASRESVNYKYNGMVADNVSPNQSPTTVPAGNKLNGYFTPQGTPRPAMIAPDDTEQKYIRTVYYYMNGFLQSETEVVVYTVPILSPRGY